MEKLIKAASQQTTEQILACLIQIGGSHLATPEERMVRAALIEVYGQREGEEAADMLMEQLGM